MLVITAEELIVAFEEDTELVLMNKKDSNRTKTAQRNRLAVQFLKTLPADFVLVGEHTQTSFLKMNFGTLTEIVIRAHYALEKNPTIRRLTKSADDFDIMIGNKSYEIKTCINGSYFNTRISNSTDRGVILVGAKGVRYIPKDRLWDYVDEKGKLPYKEEDLEELNHYTKIERLLGFIIEE